MPTAVLRPLLALAALAVSGTLPAAVQAQEAVRIESVTFEPHVLMVGHKLRLNGAGLNGANKGNAAGLYLVKWARNTAEALDAPGPRRLQIRFIEPQEGKAFGAALSGALRANVPGQELPDCLPGLLRLGELLATRKTLAAGDELNLDFIPGQGTFVDVKGHRIGQIDSKPFYGCLLRAYLGDKPMDGSLKAALLAAGKTK